VILQRYLDRIGVPDARTPDLATLAAVVAGHVRSIAFENLDTFTRRDISLDADALVAKLVDGRRGGWCFEQNNLLRNALDELGYRTTGLAARVVYGRPADAPPMPRSHMLLRVDGLPDGPHIVDVGFGGMTPTGVLRLEAGPTQDTPHEPFRLVAVDDELAVEVVVAGSWRRLYHFGQTPQLLVDYGVTNFYLGHHPESPFRDALSVARPEVDRRYALGSGADGVALSVYPLDGPSERTVLGSVAEIRAAIEKYFLIDLTGVAGLDERLETLLRP
jgi:arylamine N-acetyltransferase